MGTSNYPKGFANGVSLRNVPVYETHPGRVYWVYNGTALLVGQRGGSDQNKGTFDAPFSTLDYAVGQCTANRGDIIMVKAGHNENFAGADAVDVDVAGVSIIGLGNGADVPTFDHDATASELVIGAANVLLENLRFRPGTNAVTNAINIEAAGDRYTIRGCRFADPEAATDEFADAIIVEAGADEGVIEDCVFSADAQAAVAAIELNGAVIGVTIRNNEFIGDYSTACIRGDTTLSQKVLIEDNLLWNGDPLAGGLNAQPAIELLTGTIGVIRNNHIACDLTRVALAIVADSCFLFNNTYQEDTGVNSIVDANAALGWRVAHTVVSTSMATQFDTGDSPVTMFTVTGDVLVLGVWWVTGGTAVSSDSDLAVISMGVTNDTAALQATFTVASGAMAANDVWSNGVSAEGAPIESAGVPYAISGDATNIIMTIVTQNIAGGVGDCYCMWAPVSPGASVVGLTI